jgi:hypothetical protein
MGHVDFASILGGHKKISAAVADGCPHSSERKSQLWGLASVLRLRYVLDKRLSLQIRALFVSIHFIALYHMRTFANNA